jgi:hypothetical protein
MVLHLKNELRLWLGRMSIWKIQLLLSKESGRRCLMILRKALRILIKKRFANANLVE